MASKTTTSILLVPVHLDALFVERPHDVVPPMADFSRLPFFNGKADVNPSVPWLGEAIASRPFQDAMLQLGRGMHLHWALPDALSHARATGLPAAPDRWLVTRGIERDGRRDIQMQWVVESNYLYPADSASGAAPPDAITYPHPADLRPTRGHQPYRHLGRAIPLERWRRNEGGAEYLAEPLTALGFGQPSFAAFYPNCKSVFGLHDADVMAPLPEGLYYELLGWYDTPEHDALRAAVVALSGGAHHVSPQTFDEALAAMRWQAAQPPVPRQLAMVCHARLTFQRSAVTAAPDRIAAPSVALGNTTAEALSAYLAASGDPAHRLELEDQLEAVLLASTLDHRQVDLASRFDEARHAKGFSSVPPAMLWAIRPNMPGAVQSQADAWPDAAHLLDELNALQKRYDALWDEIRARRRQLASDWHTYMNVAYATDGTHAHADQVRQLIERSIPPLAALLEQCGEIHATPERPDTIALAPGTSPRAIATALIAKAAELRQVLVAHAVKLVPLRRPDEPHPDTPPAVHPAFTLQRVVAPRFFQPTEPVVLLTGDAARASDRYRRTGEALACTWVVVDGAITDHLEDITSHLTQQGAWNERVWSAPWHPFLLEWEVALRPFSNLGNDSGAYDPKFITRNFTLLRGTADLSQRSESPLLRPTPHVYSGSSLLTPHGVRTYAAQLESYLERDAAARALPDAERSRAVLPDETRARLQTVLAKLGTHYAMAQSLSGFNDALLMNQQLLQLPIEDPLGSEDDRAFASRVAGMLGGPVHRSPQPDHGFSPIRAGALRLSRLRLIDTFGQAIDIDCDAATKHSAKTLPVRDNGRAVMLPPRVVQPMRLSFRWRAAGEAIESNSHPDTSPICGWVVANHIDQSLFVYDEDGSALGFLERAGERIRWRPMPGQDNPVLQLDSGIKDATLRKMVRSFLDHRPKYFEVFIADLEAAQDRIEPESEGEPSLMGRPLALVRAKLSLQLKGPAAVHQGLPALLADLSRPQRTSDGVSHVRFPLRLGEQDQLGDGVAVYWEDEQFDTYIIPSYLQDDETDPQDKRCDFLYLTPEALPLSVTMLVDPRAPVHAAMGVLPVKAITIPPHHYQDILARLETSFLVAPMLVAGGERAVIHEGWMKVAP